MTAGVVLCPECARRRGFDSKDAGGGILAQVCPDCGERALCCEYSWPVLAPGEALGPPKPPREHLCPECEVRMEHAGVSPKNPNQHWECCPECGTQWELELHGAEGPSTPIGDSYGLTFTYWK